MENVHKEHRLRLKRRFIKEGLENFEEHNTLELLLFYSVPQKDTNELAHALIDRFGSVSGVLDAPYDALITVPGIKENSATLLKLIPQLCKKYVSEKTKKADRFNGSDDIGKYFLPLFIGETDECVRLLLLDNGRRAIDCVKVYEGSVNSSSVAPRKLIELALLKKAAAVALAHNHPGGIAVPSGDDINTTYALKTAFSNIGIPLVSHINVAVNKFTYII